MEILSVTIPIFMFVTVGYIGKKIGLIGIETRNFLSKLVYYLALPALIFRSIVSSDFKSTFRIDLIAHNVMVTLTIFIMTFMIAFLIKKRHKRGSFNMTCFRSNQGYMGLPVVNGFYGEGAMSRAAVVNSIDSPVVIAISVFALEIFRGRQINKNGEADKLSKVVLEKFIGFITNPFVIPTIIALGLSYFNVPILKIKILDEFLKISGYMALPLALISIGCSVDIKHLKDNIALVTIGAFIKLIIMPVFAFILGYYFFNFRGTDLGIAVILTAMPTSVSSFIMACEMDTDEKLMATAIGFTTFLSIITISLIQFILKMYI